MTAPVGGDERVRTAHRYAVDAALRATEPFVQARIGRNLPAETAGQWVAAKFEHDSAGPLAGYSAPQLATERGAACCSGVLRTITRRRDGRLVQSIP